MPGRMKTGRLGRFATNNPARLGILNRRKEKATNVWGRVMIPVQAGIMAKPAWYDTVSRFPPAPKQHAHEPTVISFPEDRLHAILLKKIPVLRLQRHSPGKQQMPTIAESFARRQQKLIQGDAANSKGKMSEEEAFRECLKSFAPQIDAFEKHLLMKKKYNFDNNSNLKSDGSGARKSSSSSSSNTAANSSMSPLERKASMRIPAVVAARKRQLGIADDDDQTPLFEDAVDMHGGVAKDPHGEARDSFERMLLGVEHVNRMSKALKHSLDPEGDKDLEKRKQRFKTTYAGLRLGPRLIDNEMVEELKKVNPYAARTRSSWIERQWERNSEEGLAYLNEWRAKGRGGGR